jgi:hypothetical protein
MSSVADCGVIGRWRIVGSDTWDRDYLDLVGPAFININRGGRGELASEVVNVSLNLEYSQTMEVVFYLVILPQNSSGMAPLSLLLSSHRSPPGRQGLTPSTSSRTGFLLSFDQASVGG